MCLPLTRRGMKAGMGHSARKQQSTSCSFSKKAISDELDVSNQTATAMLQARALADVGPAGCLKVLPGSYFCLDQADSKQAMLQRQHVDNA